MTILEMCRKWDLNSGDFFKGIERLSCRFIALKKRIGGIFIKVGFSQDKKNEGMPLQNNRIKCLMTGNHKGNKKSLFWRDMERLAL